jgi:protein O-mannosyl-transferase
LSTRGKGKARTVASAAANGPAAPSVAWRHAAALAALLVVVWLAWFNSFEAPLIYDNDAAILKDTRVHAATAAQVQRIFGSEYWETHPDGLYRPLTTLSFLFNYAVLGDGPNPDGYHWFNFLLHALNAMLVYALGLALFGEIPAALLLSALWAVHPVLTESVTNVVGRSDMLAAFAVLATLLLHRAALRSAGWRRAACLLAIALAVAIGIFSKESAIVVIAAVALYDFTFDSDAPWRARLWTYAAIVAPCAIFFVQRAQVLARTPHVPFRIAENSLAGGGFVASRLTAVKVIGDYVGLLLWPSQLSFDYSYNQVPLFRATMSSWNDWQAILAAIACVAALGAAVRYRRRAAPLFFAVFLFFIALAPTSNVFLLIGTVKAERFLYLPAVAAALAVVWAARTAIADRRIVYGVAGVVLLALAIRTHARNADWADPQRLWASGVEAAPQSFRTNIYAASNLRVATLADLDRSIAYARRALSILKDLPDDQSSAEAYFDAAHVYRVVGEQLASGRMVAPSAVGTTPAQWYQSALEALDRAEAVDTAYGVRYRAENARRGLPGEAPVNSRLYLELGLTYMRLSDPQHAVEAFERGRMLESDPDVLEQAAAAYEAIGEPRKAALALVEALAVDPKRTHIGGKLVQLYGQFDPSGCSISKEGGEVSLNVQCPLVHNDICTASKRVAGTYSRRGQMKESDEIRRVAMQELGCSAESMQ